MKKLTKEWVQKAEADYRLAGKLVSGSEPFHDHVCFLCQQAAEKYLKALLEELGLPVPRIHNLVQLLTLLLPHYPSLRPLRRGLKFLTRFAVGTRYPGEKGNKRTAHAAYRWASKARELVRLLLGIRPPRTRRKKSP
jgi:HEPN domain-containing protein